MQHGPITLCQGRTCRPGEGNPSVTHSANPHKLAPPPDDWLRDPPHGADTTHYAPLVAAATAAARHRLIILCAADFDYRELAENWYLAIKRVGLTNGLVYSLDEPAHRHLQLRGVPSVDGSSNLDDWNRTRLSRHIQRVEAERHIATAALAASGLDVLLTDSTHVMLSDVTPALHALRGHREAVDVAAPRLLCNGKPPFGCSVWWNLVFLRGAGTSEERSRAVHFQTAGVRKGMVDFYLRWYNGAHAIVQGFGKLVAGCPNALQGGITAADLVGDNNRTAVMRSCTADAALGPVRIGLLPPSFFDQPALYGNATRPRAAGSHFFRPPKPFQRDRLNLNRYDEQDFDEVVAALRAEHLWFV